MSGNGFYSLNQECQEQHDRWLSAVVLMAKSDPAGASGSMGFDGAISQVTELSSAVPQGQRVIRNSFVIDKDEYKSRPTPRLNSGGTTPCSGMISFNRPRDDDIGISNPPKRGTTWVQISRVTATSLPSTLRGGLGVRKRWRTPSTTLR
jgi:hypothetical protein